MRSEYLCLRSHTNHLLVLILLLLTLSFLSYPQTSFSGITQLMMNPVRVIFNDRQRAISVHVINNSQEQVTYTISLVTMRKKRDGSFYEPKDESEQEKMIKQMIRFSPRRATIDTRQRQVVKLMVRKPKDLPPGEYITYLQLSPQQQRPNFIDSPADQQTSNEEPTVDLDVVVNSVFPIIIQHGELTPDVTPLSISIKSFTKTSVGIAAEIVFSRSGEYSSFGDVFLTYIPSDKPNNERRIGIIQGMAIYQPETKRTITIPLTEITRQELLQGNIRVDYKPNTGVVKERKQKDTFISKTFPLH